MATIQIKGINDYLLFLCDDEVCDDEIFDSLKVVLSSPSFHHKGFYPKAYFDFGKRILDENFFNKLMYVLDTSQSVLFCGLLKPEKQNRKMVHIHQTIRNGEIVHKKEDCIFDGKINPGGKLIVEGNLYCLGSCFGSIILIGSDVACYVSHMKGASIQINQLRKEEINIDTMSVFYIEDNSIKMKQEEYYYG